MISEFNKKMVQNENIKLFVRYAIIGGIATLIDLSLLYVLTDFFNIWYFYSAIISFFIAMIPHYLLNKYFNFKNKSKKIFSQFGLFIIVILVGLGLNLSILYLLVEFLGFWYMYARVISIIITLTWNFYWTKKITFNIFK